MSANDAIAAPAPTSQSFHKVKAFTMGIVASDVIAAGATASITSVIIAMVDKSIMDKTLGNTPSIRAGLSDATQTLCTAPWRFFMTTSPPNNYAQVYRLVFLVYGMTYVAGNLTQSYYESQQRDFYLQKFSAGSIVNVGLTLYKDNSMLQILKTTGGAVPNLSRLLFVLRDSLTVLASFWLAPLVAKAFRRMDPTLSERSASDRADFLVPATAQFISTPLHLYGIALKEHPTMTNAELFKIVRRDYFPAVGARCARIIPAYGFGMMFMKRVRSQMHDRVEGPN